jgi:hypothetical protein
VFQIAFVVLAGLTFVYYAAFVSSLPQPFIHCSFGVSLPEPKGLTLFPSKFRDGEEENPVAGSNFLPKVCFA